MSHHLRSYGLVPGVSRPLDLQHQGEAESRSHHVLRHPLATGVSRPLDEAELGRESTSHHLHAYGLVPGAS